MIVAAPTRMDDQNRCYSTKQIERESSIY